MRLINTRTLRIHEFLGKVPPYAILSHTWGREELTYQNFITPGVRERKAGYAKVKAACRQARMHGLDYAWVDSCCIDKTSSAELGEAINSMFRWYQNAEICYAFLEDVTTTTRAEPMTSALSVGDVGFGHSRWFTRGWTLQELIAPHNVEFYNKDWVKMGEKNSLANQLQDITGVDAFVLKGGALSHVSIGKRMSWASNRETTRPEDVAYSLLGIFNVNMPLVYGEGVKAFQRLQEEILRQSDDHTIFAWQSTQQQGKDNSTTGLLAVSPSQFRNFVDQTGPSQALDVTNRPSGFVKQQIVRVWDYNAPNNPISLTNKGITMKARVVDLQAPQPRERMVLVLNCSPEGNPFRLMGIYIKHQRGNRYARVRPDVLVEVELPDEDFETCTIHCLRSTEDVRGHHYDEPWTSTSKISKELAYEAMFGSLGDLASTRDRYENAIYMDKSLFRRRFIFDSYILHAIFTSDGVGRLRFFRFDTKDHADVVIKNNPGFRAVLVLRSRSDPSDILLIPFATSSWDGQVLYFDALRVHEASLTQSPQQIINLCSQPLVPNGNKAVRLSNELFRVKVIIKSMRVIGIPMQAIKISRLWPISSRGWIKSFSESIALLAVFGIPLMITGKFIYPLPLPWIFQAGLQSLNKTISALIAGS